MTIKEYVYEELSKRGFHKAQFLNSKTLSCGIDIILGLIDNSLFDLLEEKAKLQDECKQLEKEIEKMRFTIRSAERNKEEAKRLYDEVSEAKEYIHKFNESLMKCESAEGRDTMRKAQMFVNTVNIDTKFDNTAFIVGFAGILSGEKVKAIDEMQKLNPELFKKRF